MVDIVGLQKLAQTSRTRKNMEKVAAAIGEVAEEHRSAIEEWLEAASGIRDALTSFTEKSDELSAGVMNEGAQSKLLNLCNELERYVPSEDGMLAALPEHVDTVTEGLDELENMLEDRDYTADDRDDKWYEITEALDNVATGLDELSVLGVNLKSSGEGEDGEH